MFVNFVSAGGGVTCGLVGYAGFAMTEVPRYAHVISRCAQHRETTRLMKHILSSNTVICSVVYETTYTLTPNPVASRSERDCAQAEYPGSYFENVVALPLSRDELYPFEAGRGVHTFDHTITIISHAILDVMTYTLMTYTRCSNVYLGTLHPRRCLEPRKMLYSLRRSEPKRRRRTRVVDCIETDGRRATRGRAVPYRPLVRAAAPHAVEGELQARLGLRRHLLLRGGALAQRLGGDGNAPDERGRAEHVHEEVVVVGARRLGFLNVKVDS